MAKLPRKGLIGFFNDPDDLLHAAAEADAEGYRNMDAYSPYPIHGIEEVLRIRRSWIPAAALFMLCTGAALGFLLQYWTHVLDFPINIGGKPLNAWPAYIVIVFESGVLLSALTNFLAIFVACRLFPNPCTKPLDINITNDRFALVIPTKKPGQQEEAANLLQRMGADEIRTLDN